MNVSLTPKLEKLVQKKLQTGLYNSASEVVREALRMFEEKERFRDLKLQELRKEIAVGTEQLNRGKGISAEDVFARLKIRNQASQKKKQ